MLSTSMQFCLDLHITQLVTRSKIINKPFHYLFVLSTKCHHFAFLLSSTKVSSLSEALLKTPGSSCAFIPKRRHPLLNRLANQQHSLREEAGRKWVERLWEAQLKVTIAFRHHSEWVGVGS